MNVESTVKAASSSSKKKGGPYAIIIERLLKDTSNPRVWGRETKILKKLAETHTLEFWQNFEPDFKVNSLAFFLTGKGRRVIDNKIAENAAVERITKEEIMLPNKVGADKQIEKIKSFKDFLKI